MLEHHYNYVVSLLKDRCPDSQDIAHLPLDRVSASVYTRIYVFNDKWIYLNKHITPLN
ncbi:hypothetical protein MBAV_005569 [Candidatus Magnetobacterium bavaricum]|uniref:Uncharacterized protein n=1 Tax=Candidatus Magnetobacterium bavaricum TaxID=29290 RepID=A0A0F3GK62_9BACT|nr:hypothetical protein MBAV_005569 [Candidatus Magnetobacterium bavaricum]